MTYESVAELLRQNEVGRSTHIETPFGQRLICYADLTATGRFLRFVDAWIRRVRPFYANTHTEVSSTGRIMSELREQARDIVRRSLKAGPEDEVLFVGAGATAAVNKLIGLLGLRIPDPLEREFGLSQHIPRERRPVVILGPYEHHSNELPWLESIAEVVEVELAPNGTIDVADLQRKLQTFSERPLKIGAFSAASNVDGILSDVPAIARTLHRGGAVACIDFAAAGPYVPIDMHPADPEARLDSVVLSTHKFLGGPQGSGILAAHRALFRTRAPERPGGGTVDYVAAVDHGSVDYSARLDEREEGGTPAIIGDLRAGLAFLVKERAGAGRILEHECRIAAAACSRLARHPRVRILGPANLPRLAIISFNIEGLHHDLVSALLDHLFGIQNRAGCSCAGPYGHRLLGIDRPHSERLRRQIARGLLGIKPGWVRISLPYYASESDIDFILRAIEFVAEHGLEFVPLYRLSWTDGVWRHLQKPEAALPLELSPEALFRTEASDPERDRVLSEAEVRDERARYFQEADRIAAELRARWSREPPQWNRPTGDAEIDSLVWFKYVHTDWAAQ